MLRSNPSSWVFMWTFLLATPAVAQVQVSPSLQSTDQREKTDEPEVKVLPIHAADQPDPLLRFRLWPAPEKRVSQNPLPLVSRALLLSVQVSPETKKEFAENFNRWSEMPLGQLPVDEVRKMLGSYETALAELRRAENLMQIDYDIRIDQMTANEMISTLLPEFQEMRQLARLLYLRSRVAVAEQRWDDAVDDWRIGFRLAEVAAHSTDFLIGRLVGFAIAGIMMQTIEEAIQQPGCPNLYWALASLPDARLFETRTALEFESVLMSRIFASAGSLPDTPIGEVAAREKIRAFVNEANRTLASAGDPVGVSVNSQLVAGFYVVTLAEPSRELLAETKQWGERAWKLSASEAVLRATLLKFARIRDRWVAWSSLPPELWDEYEAERKQAFGVGAAKTDLLLSLVAMLMPAVEAARTAGLRSHQQRNWLMTIEAIRMHASEAGELPSSIDKLRPVPAFGDAIADKPFGYQRSSANKATLTRSPRYPGDTETVIHVELKGQ